MTPSPRRLAAAAGALVVCAWFGLGVVQERSEAKATGLIQRLDFQRTAASDEAQRQLDRAGFLNPDRRVDLLEAMRAIGAGEPQRGRAALAAVVRAEPENLLAWAQIRLALAETDPDLAAEADRRLTRLDPWRARR